jgi:L-lysine exporter family protein LysE/ArgO
MIASALAGFTTSIGLIAAIGAQNAFVLKQGLRREHVLAIVITCAASDALLIAAGIAGLGAVVQSQPGLVTGIRWAGAAFLAGYAVLAARRALKPSALVASVRAPARLGATLLACLAFTYLNPHVYIDTVLLLGAIANQQTHQWVFGIGAAAASAVWFTALGLGAHKLAPLLSRPTTWRVIDGLIAVMMLAIAVMLIATR